MNMRGFTLIELVVIIVIISALSVTAFGRFTSGESLEARGARDELASAFRLAQRYAITSGCDTRVTVTANSYTVMMENPPCGSGNPFGTSIASPGGGGTLAGSFSGTTLAPTGNSVYDAYGDLVSGGGAFTISSGGETAGFTVQGGSGFVDLP